MIGIDSILLGFYKDENRITPYSIWSSKIEEGRCVLLKNNAIQYMIGYPFDSEPTFYVFCDTEELMDHTKDWLNCSLPRFYCKYARPCKEPEYLFESILFKKWPHGFLKVPIWSRGRVGVDYSVYKLFLGEGIKQSKLALEEMINRYNLSPTIKVGRDKPIGMLIKSFFSAYHAGDLEEMELVYRMIISRDELERRNKDTLKFMLLEKERKWTDIIQLAHERNVVSQVISSGVATAILNALVYQSCEDEKSLECFEIDWPTLYDRAQEFSPLLIMAYSFEDESHWYLWCVLAQTLNIEGFADKARGKVDEAWLNSLLEQDTSVNAQKIMLVDALDVRTLEYDEQTVSEVLNYTQTCYESELMRVYEWLEASPVSIKLSIKAQVPLRRLWQKLESNVANCLITNLV